MKLISKINNTALSTLFKIFAFSITILFILNCDGPFIAENKSNLPSDHKSNQNGFIHKDGMENPYRMDPITGEKNCANSDCHGEDLRGGVVFVEGENNVAPSCYQCHDQKWNDLSKINWKKYHEKNHFILADVNHKLLLSRN